MLNINSKIKKLGLAGLVCAQLMACSSQEDAIRAAQSAGWSDVQVTSQSYFLNFKCSEDEMAYTIKGKNPSNKPSRATVCCGFTTPFKGCTIRY